MHTVYNYYMDCNHDYKLATNWGALVLSRSLTTLNEFQYQLRAVGDLSRHASW
jgi:hypothetical protein